MNRKEQLERLKANNNFDVIIIGGGATGLGCAVDASNRGMKTLLLEKYDFAKGTSSRATKLVHGGVRYLAQGNIRLVREALQERGRLLQNAPHVCHPLSFVLPTYSLSQKLYFGFGLWLYEFLSAKLSLGKSRLLSKEKVLQYLPDLSAKKLNGGILYFDGQFDDSRLAINLAQTAIEQNAIVLNYFAVTGFIKDGNNIVGIKATDQINGNNFEIKAKVVINATGVFADEMLQLSEGHAEKTITPSQGIHLVVEKHFFKIEAGMMIPKTDDGRVLFAIPWYNKLLIGTTDTPVDAIEIEPKPLKDEIDFLINHFNRYATLQISSADIKTVFVGLRPLAKASVEKKTAVMPRDHVIKVLPSGLVHVTGGKWTTYRNIAEHTIDIVVKKSGKKFNKCNTKNLKIHGYSSNKNESHLTVYGEDAAAIKEMIENDKTFAEKIHINYPYTKAEVIWFVQNEMAVTVEDVLARRIRLLFLDARASIETAPIVAKILSTYTGKNQLWEAEQIKIFTTLANGYLIHP